MVELEVKIEAGDLYDFMLMHHCHKAGTLIANVIGALAIVIGFAIEFWILVILGFMMLLYLPWVLFLKSRQQVILNPSFQEKLTYTLDETGISVTQGENHEHQDWDAMVKAVSTTRSIIVYTSIINATIFPRKQMGDKAMYVVEMISKHMPADKVKIRW